MESSWIVHGPKISAFLLAVSNVIFCFQSLLSLKHFQPLFTQSKYLTRKSNVRYFWPHLAVGIFILARRLPDGADVKIKSWRSPTIQIWRLKIGHVQRIKVDRDDSPILAEWTLGLQLSLNSPACPQLAKVFSRVFHNTLSRVFDNTFAKAFSEYFLRNFQNNFHLFSQNIFPRVFLSFSCVDTCLDLGACLSQCTNFQSRIFNTREENCQKIVVLSND